MATFALHVRTWANAQKEGMDKSFRRVLFSAWGELIVRSPVDTGRFRQNWIYSIDETVDRTIEATGSSDSPAPPPAAPNIGPVIGHVHYIQNNLPYARRLEYGYSKQAPEGMVRLTIDGLFPITDESGTAVNPGLGFAQ